MDVMADLIRHTLGTAYGDLPKGAVESARKAILDTLGAIIAGSSEKAPPLLLNQVREWGGAGEGTVAVFGDRVPAPAAAYLNGTMARALELADVYDGFPLHPSSSTVPAALAAAEKRGGVSGRELIAAVALAQDLIVRFAQAVKIGPIRSGRYNLFKIFPPTAAAGRILGLGEGRLMNAMGIAFTQMVGDGQSAHDGAMTHYLQQGVVARSALESALLARQGITGSDNVLEGRAGLFRAYEPEHDLAALTRDLGQSFRGEDLSIKFYSSCRATHEAIDLALALAREENPDPEEIREIEVRVNEAVYNLTCGRARIRPRTEVEAQFSLPYCVAAAIVRGDVFVAELKEETFADPRVTGLAERVRPVLDPERESDLIIGSTRMEVRTREGRVWARETSFPRGNPRNPVGLDQCAAKFEKCAVYSARPLGAGRIAEIISFVTDLERAEDVAPLAGLLVAEE